MKSAIFKTLFAVVILLSVFSCDDEDVLIIPESYPMPELSLYPEGIIYSDDNDRTYVGSYFKGKIITVDLFGNISDFVIDESLVAVVGMVIDRENNRLLVCNSDAGISMRSDPSTTGQLAEVIAYDLTSGAKQKTIDLSGLYQGGQFLNDLVMDNDGNIYVTNSFSPVIYKIDNNDVPSVLVSDTIFNVPPQTFGLNGIVYHEDNYLIVGKSFGGVLYKVPLDNPEDIQEIPLNISVNSLDGLLLTDNTLMLVSNNFTGAPFDEAIYEIETSDNWSSGTVERTFKDLEGAYPTTMTEIEGELFVSYGYFPELIDPNSAPNDNFLLHKVLFK